VRSRQPGSRPEDAGQMSYQGALGGGVHRVTAARKCDRRGSGFVQRLWISVAKGHGPSIRAGWTDKMAPVITEYASWILFAYGHEPLRPLRRPELRCGHPLRPSSPHRRRRLGHGQSGHVRLHPLWHRVARGGLP
jgi:hypothetical protein